MLHRAIFGSLERFIAIVLEHYADRLPLWLAPVQVVVMNITDRQAEYVQEIAEKLTNQGFRSIIDLRNEKIGFKIREHTIARVPYQLVIGDREVAERTLSVRRLGKEQSITMSIADFATQLRIEIDQKNLLEDNS